MADTRFDRIAAVMIQRGYRLGVGVLKHGGESLPTVEVDRPGAEHVWAWCPYERDDVNGRTRALIAASRQAIART